MRTSRRKWKRACAGCAVAVGLLLAGWLGTVEAAPILEDGFDSGTVGVPPAGWEEQYYSWSGTPYSRAEAAAFGVTIQVTDSVSFAGGNSVHFLDTSTGTGSGVGSEIIRDLSPTSFLILEYYMRSDNNAYEGAFVCLQGDGGTDYMANFGNAAGGAGVTGYIGVFSWMGRWIQPTLMPYQEGRWYYVRRELDCATNAGSFYVEDVSDPANHAAYSVGSNYVNSSINRIRVLTSNSQGADAYIDQLSGVVPEPTTLVLLGLGLMGLSLAKSRRAA